jgi:hypothetical protein
MQQHSLFMTLCQLHACSLEEPKAEEGKSDESARPRIGGALPRAHTCFNQIVLPEYKSYDQLIDRLTFAIVNTSDEFLMS